MNKSDQKITEMRLIAEANQEAQIFMIVSNFWNEPHPQFDEVCREYVALLEEGAASEGIRQRFRGAKKQALTKDADTYLCNGGAVEQLQVPHLILTADNLAAQALNEMLRETVLSVRLRFFSSRKSSEPATGDEMAEFIIERAPHLLHQFTIEELINPTGYEEVLPVSLTLPVALDAQEALT